MHRYVNGRADIAAIIELWRRIQFMCVGDARFVWWACCAGSGALVLHWRGNSIIGRRHGPAGSDATVTMGKAFNYTWDEGKAVRAITI